MWTFADMKDMGWGWSMNYSNLKLLERTFVMALAALLKEVKFENFIPQFMRLSNVTSIWKSKGRKKLSSDRGIFVLTIYCHDYGPAAV